MLELSKWDLDVETNDGEEYTSLVRAVRRTHQRFKLLFVSCSPSQGEKIRGDLMADLPTKKYQLLDIKESIDNLYEAINNIPNLTELDVIFIRGLEYSIFEYEDREFGDISKRSQSKVYGGSWADVPPVLAKLNMQRELFRDRFPHICFVFLLPRFAIDYFIRRAPDFYDWKSGIYRFETDVKDLHLQLAEIWHSANYEQYTQLTSEEKLAKISEIRACLDEVNNLQIKWQLLFQLGLLYGACDRYLAALDVFDRTLEIYPDIEAYNNRGISLNKLGRYEEAIDSFDIALKIKPTVEIWNDRGVSLNGLGRYEEAMGSFDLALKINPNHDKTWNNRGIVLNNLGKYTDAIISYGHAIQINSDYDIAWNNLGNALFNTGEYEEAIDSYEKALKIQPARHDTWYNYGLVLDKVGKHEKAIESYNHALQIQSDDYDIYYNIARALSNLGKYEEAIYIYDNILEVEPNDYATWGNRGNALGDLGRYEEAIYSYDRVIQTKPNDDNAWINKGFTFSQWGKYQESLNAYEQAITLKPDKYDAYYYKGLVLFQLGNYDEALTVWQEVFKIISNLKLHNTSNLIKRFLDEQLLPKFQQPAVRDILPQILTIYTTAQVLPELGVALTSNLKAIQSPTISDYTATEWLNMWQELGKPHPELALALRMLEAGIKYKQNPTDDRVFLSLPQEMRPLLREALGLE
jgi:tetratricopeptide (TPR) repeat protein